MRSTHTYAVLKVSPEAHAEIAEIKAKLLAAGYQHAIDGDTIDMQGIALEPEENTQAHQNTPAIAGTGLAQSGDGLPAGVQPFDPREPWSPKSIP